MIWFSGAFDPDTGECTVQVDNGRGDVVAEFTDRDPCVALRVALDEARWTPTVTIEPSPRLLQMLTQEVWMMLWAIGTRQHLEETQRVLALLELTGPSTTTERLYQLSLSNDTNEAA